MAKVITKNHNSGGMKAIKIISILDELESKPEYGKYKFSSLGDLAYLLSQEGKSFLQNNNRGYVLSEALIFDRKGTYLTKDSPILYSSKEVMFFHRKGLEYYLTSDQVDKSLKDPKRTNSIRIPSEGFSFSPKDIGKNNKYGMMARFLFGINDLKFGKFLMRHEIKKISFRLLEKYKVKYPANSFARQITLNPFQIKNGKLDDKEVIFSCGTYGSGNGRSILGIVKKDFNAEFN